MSKNKIVLLPFNDAFGGGDYYELVPFGAPTGGNKEMRETFVLKPIDKGPNFKKMTKKQLIEYIEDL